MMYMYATTKANIGVYYFVEVQNGVKKQNKKTWTAKCMSKSVMIMTK